MHRYLQLKSMKRMGHWEKQLAKLMPAAALHWPEILTFWLNIKNICIVDENIIISTYTARN